MSERKVYPAHEVPQHPQAERIAQQLKLLDCLLSRWYWEVLPNGQLMVTTEIRGYGRSLRIWVKDDVVNIDVLCGHVAFNAHMLTWILTENFAQRFVARATSPENGLVPIYLTADFSLACLDELAQLVWEGCQASLTWWGRIIRVKSPSSPSEPQALSA